MVYTNGLHYYSFQTMTDIYLVRHGQASAGTDNYDRLSSTGIEQAQLLGEYWSQLGVSFTAAFCGSLERQQHTAQLALAGTSTPTPVTTLEALNEYDHQVVDQLFGQGQTSDSGMDLSFDQYLDIMRRWENADDEIVNSTDVEFESYNDFAQRGWHAIQNAANSQQSSSLVFFTSGGVVSTIMQQVMGLDFKQTMHLVWQTRNASITQLRVDHKDHTAGNTCLVSYNDITHLLLRQDKKLITLI